MERPKFLTDTFLTNLGRYALCFLPFLIAPVIAKPLALFFDFVQYGQWISFFYQLLIGLTWLFSLLALIIVDGQIRKKRKKCALATAEQTQMREVLKMPKQKSEKLPLVNVIVLSVIVFFCVIAISAQIGFQVKPFFDIGEKNVAPQLWGKVTVILRNIVKCVWIMYLLNAALKMSGEIFADVTDEKAKEWLTWIIAGFFLMAFGIYDVVTSCQNFTLTYIIFYALFPVIHCLTRKNNVKSCLIIAFIYLF